MGDFILRFDVSNIIIKNGKTMYVKFIKKFKYLNIIKWFPPLHRGLYETKRGWGGGGRGEENERRTMRRETRRRQAPAFSPLHGPLCATMVTGWHELVPIQILLIFGGRCNRYFWDIRLKIYLILIRSFSSASKIIQARTFFLGKESWSRDQLLQKAY